MCQVNVFQAKTEFSKLISMLESNSEDEIVIARNGKPVARLTRYEGLSGKPRIGAAKGLFRMPEDFDADDAAIAALMSGEDA
jgi:antitoxin (DNA-binding transcriptional repressor) of toxin-antitoxin stability system